jgi:hypothetical protein
MRAAMLPLAALLLSPSASAHGLFGHVHVTGWAIENLPPGELRDFFAEPGTKEAALAGAMFPDTGYAIDQPGSRSYAEHSHWEPFIESFIQQIRANPGDPWDTPEERQLVAFLFGAASHGLQDELFDSTFLFETEQRDPEGSQTTADPGTDGFLVQDGHARLYPGPFLPAETLIPLYADLADAELIQPDLLREGADYVTGFYLNDGLGVEIAKRVGEAHRELIPWAAAHYLDGSVAGAHRAEIRPTMKHMQALWDRLHAGLDPADRLVHTWPEPGRRLREADHTSVASWATMVLGIGVVPDSTSGSLVSANGEPVDFDLVYTRWGGVSRIVRFQPREDLEPGGIYTATLDAGALLVDGTVTDRPIQFSFQVSCADERDPRCPFLGGAIDPRIEPDERLPTAFPTWLGEGGCAQASGAAGWAAALTAAAMRRRRPTSRRGP